MTEPVTHLSRASAAVSKNKKGRVPSQNPALPRPPAKLRTEHQERLPFSLAPADLALADYNQVTRSAGRM
jgi:hypothetical protein